MKISDPVEARFLKHVVEREAGLKPLPRPNLEVRALFDAIQAAFTSTTNKRFTDYRWVTDPEMVAMLAACAWVALEYNREQEIPLDSSDHDYIGLRLLRYFMYTLAAGVRAGATWRDGEGKTHFGCFRLPDWFVDWARELHDRSEFHPPQSPPQYLTH